MVGRLAGWYSRLFDMSRLPDGRFTANAAASVHGSVLLDGMVIQHYPFTASCWASGSRYPNTHFVAFENESQYTAGRPDEGLPLTDAQVAANTRIIYDLCRWRGWTPKRPVSASDVAATLYEHRECLRWGSAPTACPSGRIPWDRLIADIREAEMSEQEKLELKLRRGAALLQKKLANLDFQGVANALAWLGVRPQ